MKPHQIITAIAAAAVIGAVTEATKFFPNMAEIFVAVNILVSAVTSYILRPKDEV